MAGQIVTLLFTDLAESSALLHRLGDERGEQMRRLHFGILREAVAESGGEEVKNLGDGLMVVFDSGVGALRSAIAMQQAIRRHNDTGGHSLGVRVGLHVGEPIRDEDDYFGTAVVVAKRLCDAAEAGQILVSDLVHGLVAGRSGFTFTPVDDVPLKGMNASVTTFALEWAEEPTAAPLRAAGPGLIGRRDHLAHLEDRLTAAAGGDLAIVLITGEAGLGKTRLTTELTRRNHDRIVTLSARAYPLGATASLGLWVEALERYLRSLRREEVLSLCGGHAEALAALLPSVRAATREQPLTEPPRIQLLGALAGLLAGIAKRTPVVVVLDDVHLADGSSWEALNYLARNLTDSRILVVLVARPTELASHGVAGEVIRALDQEGLLSRRSVTALSADEVRELAAEIVGDDVPEALVSWLLPRTQGSPLFVGGLVRALLEEGADLEQPALRSLPEDLAERVETRTRNLEPPARAVLELLAVMGSRVELGDLLRLSGQDLEPLALIIEQLEAVRLVAELEAGRDLTYEISHPLIQEAVYRQIGGARRRALHRHAARTLVAAGRYGAAASHVVQAADPGDDEAITTLCEALRQAETGGHHREEIALLDALLVLVPAGDKRWMNVLQALPRTPEWIVDHRADTGADVVVSAMRRADQVLGRSADAAQRAAVKFSLGNLLAWSQCELDAGRELVEEARRLFAEAGDERAVLLATNELGYHAALRDDGVTQERVAREVLQAAEASADAELQLQALCSLSWALTMAGRFDEALPVVTRGGDIARQAGKLYRTSYLDAMAVFVRTWLGDGHAATFDGIKELNPAYRDTMLLDFAGQVWWFEGDLRRAVAGCRDQMAWDGGTSPRRVLGVSVAAIGLAESGRPAEASELQAAAEAATHGDDWWMHSRMVGWSGAMAACLGGERTEGLASLTQVAKSAVACGYWSWSRLIIADWADEAAWAGAATAANGALALLHEDPWPQSGPSHDGIRAFVAGAERAAAKDWDAAVPLLEDAAASFSVAGWNLYSARSAALLGASLVHLDRDRAAEVLDAAIATFEGCGATVRADRARALSDGLKRRGPRVKSLTGAGSLTTRELEVARLAAKGCSAREIAEQLFIGERTVETHLANTYAKLGVASKLDLVRRAAELGL